MWQFQGQCQYACDLLTPVYEWFTEGSDTTGVIDAKVLLEKLDE